MFRESSDVSNPDRRVTVLFISPVEQDHVTLKHAFARSNWELFRTYSLREGLDCLRERSIPVVVTDERLPRATWKQVLSATQSLPEPAKVIVASNLEDDQLWAEVLNLGGYDVLAKPLDEREMYHVVGQAWLGWKYERERPAVAAATH